MFATAKIPDYQYVNTQVLNKDYFSENIEEHLDKLYGAALRLTKVPSNAEDLVAETVTKGIGQYR